MTDHAPAAFWDQRYAERDQIWSGEPNSALVTSVTGLGPGKALDLGCGEGADSVWLAERGWVVTAVDIAATAIARAESLAARRGIPDDRITWLIEDLSVWQPTDTYDLVSACFLQSPIDFPRTEVLQRVASAVAPGGHLLVVSHAEAPPWSNALHAEHRFPTVADELAALPPDRAGWQVLVGEPRPRRAVGPDGEEATLRDNVVLARRSRYCESERR